MERSFDFTEGKRYERLLERKSGRIEVPGYAEMAARAEGTQALRGCRRMRASRLTHNDFFMLNFLIDDQDDMSLIDWEYSGMSDYASDFGTFTVCCQLSEEVRLRCTFAYYFGREPFRRSAVTTSPLVALCGMVLVRVVAAQRGRRGHGWRVAVPSITVTRRIIWTRCWTGTVREATKGSAMKGFGRMKFGLTSGFALGSLTRSSSESDCR